VYLVKGKFTSRLAQLPAGTSLEVWGPLGNGFSSKPVEHLIMVAGGIGQTPFLMLGEEFLGRRAFCDPRTLRIPQPIRPHSTQPILIFRDIPPSKRVTLLYGARSAEHLAGVEDFEKTGMEVRLATDDGSRGTKGFVTQLLTTLLDEGSSMNVRIACCGPEIMMEAVSKIALARRIPCEVSLETPMACGIGICFTCVAKVKQPDGEWDYKRTCVEGPIFCAEQLVW
jgi:dihydroorotate dehydrogenase electron transfer subunit